MRIAVVLIGAVFGSGAVVQTTEAQPGGGRAPSTLVVRASILQHAGGVLCSEQEDLHYSVDVDALAHRAVFQSVRCEVGSRETYCLRREGPAPSLERFSRRLAAVGFTKLNPSYESGFPAVTHGTTLTVTAVWGDGARQSLQTYAGQGPRAARRAQQLFLGLLAETSWEKESRTAACDFN